MQTATIHDVRTLEHELRTCRAEYNHIGAERLMTRAADFLEQRFLNYEVFAAVDDLADSEQRALNRALNAPASPENDATIVRVVRAAARRVRLWDEV